MDTLSACYEKMRNDALNVKIQRYMNICGIRVDLAKSDIVENIMQEWVVSWLENNGINCPFTPNSEKKYLLEIKAFNYKRNPVFDIADFRIYKQAIMENPWMLDITYLIFGYTMSTTGVIIINRVWKQKIWEIMCPMLSGRNKMPWPLNLRIKKGKIHEIRSGKWYSESRMFKMYETKEDFLAALEETVYQNPDTRSDGPDWIYSFLKNYQKHYGEKLIIPRWTDIADNYIIKKK